MTVNNRRRKALLSFGPFLFIILLFTNACLNNCFTLSPINLKHKSNSFCVKAIEKCSVEEAPIQEAADFFGSVFFANGDEITQELRDLVHANWLDRYGPLMGKRRFPSTVFVSKDDENMINGVIVADISVIDLANKVILQKDEADNLITSRLTQLGPKQRRVFKGATLPELLEGLLKEAPWKDTVTGVEADFVLAPVLANLAVDPSARGKGTAKDLCDQVELWSQQWISEHKSHVRGTDGSDNPSGNVLSQVWLVVEPSNEPAMNLYASKGFVQQWVDSEGNELRLVDGNLQNDVTPQCAMSKDL